jgi:hypothetical protein
VERDHQQSGIFRDDLVDKLLAVALHGQLRVNRYAQRQASQKER